MLGQFSTVSDSVCPHLYIPPSLGECDLPTSIRSAICITDQNTLNSSLFVKHLFQNYSEVGNFYSCETPERVSNTVKTKTVNMNQVGLK